MKSANLIKYSFFTVIFILLFNNTVIADRLINLKILTDEGDPIAQNNLGYSYLYGIDGEKDIDKAIYLLLKSKSS